MPFISTTFLVKKRLSHSAECDKREIKTVIPLIMARAQAEAIPNRPGTKRGRCTAFVQRPLCLWSLIVRMAGAAAVRCCLRPCKSYSSSLPENLLMT